MNDRIFAGVDVTKAHTQMLDAFESPGLGPLGVVDEGRVIFRRAVPKGSDVLDAPELGGPVDIVYAYAGSSSRLLDAARVDGLGVVVAGMGRGNVPPDMVAGVERWIADRKPVVITSRAPRGRVGKQYGYFGACRRLSELGAILGGNRRPAQARIDLMLALGAGVDPRAFIER
jgi:L-asparaginase